MLPGIIEDGESRNGLPNLFDPDFCGPLENTARHRFGTPRFAGGQAFDELRLLLERAEAVIRESVGPVPAEVETE